MKSLKKILSIFAAFMMVIGLTAANVSAAEGGTGSITIDKANNGETYTVYQILKVKSYDGDNVVYELTGNSWDNFIRNNSAYFTVTKDNEVIGKFTDESNAKEVAKLALEYAQDTQNGITATTSGKAENNSMVFSGLENGYYLVASTRGAVLSLDTATGENKTIEEKNTKEPTIDKTIVEGNTTIESNSANIGDKVNYKVTVTAKANGKNYKVTDTMTGLTFNDDIQVIQLAKETSVEQKTLTLGTDYSVTLTPENSEQKTGFILTFTESYLNSITVDNTEIEITYSGTVNSSAVIDGTADKNNGNKAKLEFGNSGATEEEKTTTSVFDIKVNKYELTGNNNTEARLGGATFALYSQDPQSSNETENAMAFDKVGTTGNTYLYNPTGTTKSFETIDTENLVLQGLKAGSYWLKEIEAPDGYNKLDTAIQVTIDAQGNVTYDGKTSESGDEVKVLNTKGTQLPSTGGMGTTMIYIAGAILMVGAAIIFVTNKRMKHE